MKLPSLGKHVTWVLEVLRDEVLLLGLRSISEMGFDDVIGSVFERRSAHRESGWAGGGMAEVVMVR